MLVLLHCQTDKMLWICSSDDIRSSEDSREMDFRKSENQRKSCFNNLLLFGPENCFLKFMTSDTLDSSASVLEHFHLANSMPLFDLIISYISVFCD